MIAPQALLAATLLAVEAPPPEPTAVADFRAICVETGARLGAVESAAKARGWRPQPSVSLPLWAKSVDGSEMTVMAGENRKEGRVRDVCHLVVRPAASEIFAAAKAWLGPSPASADATSALYVMAESAEAARRRELAFVSVSLDAETTSLMYLKPKR